MRKRFKALGVAAMAAAVVGLSAGTASADPYGIYYIYNNVGQHCWVGLEMNHPTAGVYYARAGGYQTAGASSGWTCRLSLTVDAGSSGWSDFAWTATNGSWAYTSPWEWDSDGNQARACVAAYLHGAYQSQICTGWY